MARIAIENEPWIVRGGGANLGVLSGQFCFGKNNGNAIGEVTSRIVLSPKN